MKSLELFLQALRESLFDFQGTFLPHLTISPLPSFPAIKNFSLNVWCMQKGVKELLSTTEVNKRVISDKDKESTINEIVVLTIKNILNKYGIK